MDQSAQTYELKRMIEKYFAAPTEVIAEGEAPGMEEGDYIRVRLFENQDEYTIRAGDDQPFPWVEFQDDSGSDRVKTIKLDTRLSRNLPQLAARLAVFGDSDAGPNVDSSTKQSLISMALGRNGRQLRVQNGFGFSWDPETHVDHEIFSPVCAFVPEELENLYDESTVQRLQNDADRTHSWFKDRLKDPTILDKKREENSPMPEL